MIVVGVKELKNNLSRYLAKVRAGEEIQVTDRGRPIARIEGEGRSRNPLRQALGPLVEEGVVVLPTRPLRREPDLPEASAGPALSDLVVEDRR
jgi:antitoxin (DNA-binding transcriptional repressor) of toxin-antitoxin stability system